MKKTKKAMLYVIGGGVAILLALMFMVYLWFSTFLPGMIILRKLLYLLSGLVIVLAGWFVHEGWTYLQKKSKRR